MKILRFTAANVLRLKAVEIEPDGTLQVVTGKNAAGKTSVLNAIWLALGGGAASRDIARPVRDGEEWAEVSLDLGDMTVTRTWDAEKGTTKLSVKAADGALYKTPQTLLDQLVGKLSFDPLAFTTLKPAAQREALLDLIGLDFSEADAERERLYSRREEVGREKRGHGALPKLPKDAPMLEVSASEIVDRISESQQRQAAIDERLRDQRRAEVDLDVVERQIDELTERVIRLKAQIADSPKLIAAIPEPEDIEQLRGELAKVEARNREVRENQRIAAATAAQKALEDTYAGLGQQIRGIDESKVAAIKAAEMPVAGLGLDDCGVTFGGVPFEQASSAEQIRVSLAMAMALNPELRVIRIKDGSLLDSDSMAEVARMAAESDYQVWIERVEDQSEAAVVIEDGMVARR